MEWQPIETAPRDGTKILGFGRWVESQLIPRDIWIIEYSCGEPTESYQPEGDGLFRKVINPAVGQWSVGFYPTHWMPLPAPPEVA